MKQLFLALILFGGISASLQAQNASQTVMKGDQKVEMKDGVIMQNNVVMVYKGNTSSPLTKTYTCSDGCKVSVDGTVTKPDGMTVKLKDGQGLDKSGQMVHLEESTPTAHSCTSACSKGQHAYVHGEKGHTCTTACKQKM
jgi:hypothetical protein